MKRATVLRVDGRADVAVLAWSLGCLGGCCCEGKDEQSPPCHCSLLILASWAVDASISSGVALRARPDMDRS